MEGPYFHADLPWTQYCEDDVFVHIDQSLLSSFYNNIWSSMNSMALLLLCMGEANSQTRIACSMAGREDGFVLESFGFPCCPFPTANSAKRSFKSRSGTPGRHCPEWRWDETKPCWWGKLALAHFASGDSKEACKRACNAGKVVLKQASAHGVGYVIIDGTRGRSRADETEAKNRTKINPLLLRIGGSK